MLLSFAVGAQNLIVNPSAELPPETNGWTVVSKGSEAGDCFGNSNWRVEGGQGGFPAGQAGTFLFFPGCGVNGNVFELHQDIDLTDRANQIDAGAVEVAFSGYTRSFDQTNPDAARILLEYRDAGGTVLQTFDTGNTFNVSDWVNYSDTRTAPPATRSVRVRLLTQIFTQRSADGYYDDLSLTATDIGLPVELTLFTATVDPSGYVNLRWRTATESDNDFFGVERSLEGKEWKSVTTIAGAGTTRSETNYTYTDIAPPPHQSFYYRLRQVDLDGTTTYGPVRRVITTAAAAPAATAFPNPTNGWINLVVDGDAPAEVVVYTPLLQAVATTSTGLTSGSGLTSVDLSSLTPGIYILKWEDKTVRVVRR